MCLHYAHAQLPFNLLVVMQMVCGNVHLTVDEPVAPWPSLTHSPRNTDPPTLTPKHPTPPPPYTHTHRPTAAMAQRLSDVSPEG